MKYPAHVVPSWRWLGGVVAATLAFSMALGCTPTVDYGTGTGGGAGPGGNTGGTGLPGTGGTGQPGTGGTPGTGGVPPTPPQVCTEQPDDPNLVVSPRRILRMTLRQVANTVGVMFGAAQAAAVEAKYPDELQDRSVMQFPPLNGNREGTVIIPARWAVVDDIAQMMGQYVFTNFMTATTCGANPTDMCAQNYVTATAAKAFRRPLDAMETTRLTGVYTQTKGFGASIQEATQYGVYAALSAPQFLYRYEIGSGAATGQGVALTPSELASQLSFFLTDNPPDAMLTAAAMNGSITTPATIVTHVDRLIAGTIRLPNSTMNETQPVKDSLTDVMMLYYKMNFLDLAAVDPGLFPEFNGGLRNAMYTETQRFLGQTLWNGPLSGILTSKSTFVNTDLANIIYKIPVPAGATQSAFVQTTFPATNATAGGSTAANRSGLVTMAGFITTFARSERASVVPRGLAIKETMLCAAPTLPPTGLETAVAAAAGNIPNQTGQEEVTYRNMNPICATCHAAFDAYGLVLENYDIIGRYRTVYPPNKAMGRAIDASTTLPPALGSLPVKDAVDFANVLAGNPGFLGCLTKSVMQYALSDVSTSPVTYPQGCAVAETQKKLTAAPAQTFTELLRQVSTSVAIARRK